MASNKSNEDVDSISGLFDLGDGRSCKKPDYFLFARSVILEKKTLCKDRAPFFNEWLNKEAESDPWLSLNWLGSCSFEDLVARHPDPENFRRKAVSQFYKSFRNGIMRAAAKQLRLSQEFLQLHRSVKGLVVLNELVQSYGIRELAVEVEKNLGRDECEGLDFVLLISEIPVDHENRTFPCELIISDKAYNPGIIKFHMRNFLLGWSSFNGRPVIENN